MRPSGRRSASISQPASRTARMIRSEASTAARCSSAPSPSYTNTTSRSLAKLGSRAPSLPMPITASGTAGADLVHRLAEHALADGGDRGAGLGGRQLARGVSRHHPHHVGRRVVGVHDAVGERPDPLGVRDERIGREPAGADEVREPPRRARVGRRARRRGPGLAPTASATRSSRTAPHPGRRRARSPASSPAGRARAPCRAWSPGRPDGRAPRSCAPAARTRVPRAAPASRCGRRPAAAAPDRRRPRAAAGRTAARGSSGRARSCGRTPAAARRRPSARASARSSCARAGRPAGRGSAGRGRSAAGARAGAGTGTPRRARRRRGSAT